MPARAGGWIWIAGLLAVVWPGAGRAGDWRPQLAGSLGGTFAITGTPGEGGASVSLSALWPVAPRVRFGVMFHGDDAGSSIDSLRDGRGAGLSYGRLEQVHRAAWGASWRLDADAPAWRSLTPFASGTWGLYRVGDDLRGTKLTDLSSAGYSLGAGLRQSLGPHIALGAIVRYHRLFNDHEGRFMSAGVEGSWR
jgi:hypothetical protein